MLETNSGLTSPQTLLCSEEKKSTPRPLREQPPPAQAAQVRRADADYHLYTCVASFSRTLFSRKPLNAMFVYICSRVFKGFLEIKALGHKVIYIYIYKYIWIIKRVQPLYMFIYYDAIFILVYQCFELYNYIYI